MKMQTNRLLAVLLCLMACNVQAELVHRYKFKGDVEDSKGDFDGIPTLDATYLEEPVYTKEIPDGRVTGGATKSIELGMSDGTKKSGFLLPSWVLRFDKGSYCFWMKADSVSVDDYLLGSVPGPTVVVFEQLIKLVVSGSTHMTRRFESGVWNLVVVTWDNTAGKALFYLNDESPLELAFTPGTADPGEVRIGSWSQLNNEEYLENQFNGKLYELQIYDSILDADDVVKLHQNPGIVIR